MSPDYGRYKYITTRYFHTHLWPISPFKYVHAEIPLNCPHHFLSVPDQCECSLSTIQYDNRENHTVCILAFFHFYSLLLKVAAYISV